MVPEGFEHVFAHFQVPEEVAEVRPDALSTLPLRVYSFLSSQTTDGKIGADEKGQVIYSDDELPSEDEEEDVEMSKRKQRKLNRLSVAELKRLVTKPEVVEWVDVSANDPRLLVQIKSHRNTIPIPQHWSQKRDYLQGKRGMEKPAYVLPSTVLHHCSTLFWRSDVFPLDRLHCRHWHRYSA